MARARGESVTQHADAPPVEKWPEWRLRRTTEAVGYRVRLRMRNNGGGFPHMEEPRMKRRRIAWPWR